MNEKRKRNPRRWVTALCASALCLLGALPASGQTQYGVKAGENVEKVNEVNITTEVRAVGVAEGSLTTITIAPPAENKVAKVTVTKLTEAGTIPATAIAISQADNKTEVAVGGTLQLTATPTPSYANSTITWTSSDPSLATVDNTGKVTGKATGNVVITADAGGGVQKTYNLKVIIPYEDLSLYNNDGSARSDKKMTTANCYMVHKKGLWGIPLVYGNAIKGGGDNTVAYKPGVTTTTTYCANFVNHAGNAITAPWITKSTSGTGVNKGMGIVVKSAALLWQDADGLITNVGISGDYLTFELTKDASTQEGNAVVAAKDADGTIVWSWHIWVTKQGFASTASLTFGNHTFEVAPSNLGWVSSNNANTFYQWGRKDPFPGTENVTFSINDATNNTSIADNIKNPATFYKGYDAGPCNTTYYNMWDANQKQPTNHNDNTGATTKTVYDPCPPGFCVPTDGLVSYFGYGNDMSWKTDSAPHGVYFKFKDETIFLPVTNYREYDGKLRTSGYNGWYWSASTCLDNENNVKAASVNFWDDETISWSDASRAYGLAIRPVAE